MRELFDKVLIVMDCGILLLLASFGLRSRLRMGRLQGSVSY